MHLCQQRDHSYDGSPGSAHAQENNTVSIYNRDDTTPIARLAARVTNKLLASISILEISTHTYVEYRLKRSKDYLQISFYIPFPLYVH